MKQHTRGRSFQCRGEVIGSSTMPLRSTWMSTLSSPPGLRRPKARRRLPACCVRCGTDLAGSAGTWPAWHSWLTLAMGGRHRPNLANIWPTSADVGPMSARFDQIRLNWTRCGPCLAICWPIFVPHRCMSAEFGPTSTKLGPTAVSVSTKLGASSARFGRCWPNLGPHRPNPTNLGPGFDQAWPTCDRNWEFPGVEGELERKDHCTA